MREMNISLYMHFFAVVRIFLNRLGSLNNNLNNLKFFAS